MASKVSVLFFLVLLACLPYACAQTLAPINDCGELQAMINNPSGDYELVSHVECSATQYWDGGRGFAPVGNQGAPFSGTLQGNGKIIYNLYITPDPSDSVEHQGLIGYASGATIRDLHLQSTTLKAYGTSVGSLVGYAINSIIIDCTSIYGLVSADFPLSFTVPRYYGGLIGNGDNVELIGCASQVSVDSYRDVGGLVGRLYNSKVEGCSSSGRVSTWATGGGLRTGGSGGLAGTLINVDVETTWVETSLYSNGGNLGVSNVGGFAGIVTNGGITNSYSHVNFASGIPSYMLGGFVGFLQSSSIYSSYTVTHDFIATDPFTAETEGSVSCTSSYWDKTTVGDSVSICYGASGKTTSEMQNEATYIGWDFYNIWKIDPQSYPTLRSEPHLSETPTYPPGSPGNSGGSGVDMVMVGSIVGAGSAVALLVAYIAYSRWKRSKPSIKMSRKGLLNDDDDDGTPGDEGGA